MKTIKSIRLRLTLWYIAIIAALIIILGIIAFVSLRAILVKKIDATLSHGAMVIAESLLDYKRIDKEDPLSLFDGEDIFANRIDGGNLLWGEPLLDRMHIRQPPEQHAVRINSFHLEPFGIGIRPLNDLDFAHLFTCLFIGCKGKRE